MGSHPINLAVRFLLEIAALLSMGFWGYQQSDSWLRFVMAIGLPLIAAVIWGTFAVPDDPSRSVKAPVPVPGILRLVIEIAIFGFGAWALCNLEYTLLSLILGVTVIIHYIVSYDRIGWLIKK